VCKARGIEPLDGDMDLDAVFRKEDEVTNREEADYADYEFRLKHDPAFSALRRAEAEGRM